MRDFLPLGSVLQTVTMRLRCVPCEVAWTGEAESDCWVCGEAGSPLSTAVVVRERGLLTPFDFELFV